MEPVGLLPPERLALSLSVVPTVPLAGFGVVVNVGDTFVWAGAQTWLKLKVVWVPDDVAVPARSLSAVGVQTYAWLLSGVATKVVPGNGFADFTPAFWKVTLRLVKFSLPGMTKCQPYQVSSPTGGVGQLLVL